MTIKPMTFTNRELAEGIAMRLIVTLGLDENKTFTELEQLLETMTNEALFCITNHYNIHLGKVQPDKEF